MMLCRFIGKLDLSRAGNSEKKGQSDAISVCLLKVGEAGFIPKRASIMPQSSLKGALAEEG